jgi:hypothetical protein
LRVDIVSRLANSYGMELVKAEAMRAARDQPSNPDAVDLAMRGQAILYSNLSVAAFGEAAALFERALNRRASGERIERAAHRRRSPTRGAGPEPRLHEIAGYN